MRSRRYLIPVLVLMSSALVAGDPPSAWACADRRADAAAMAPDDLPAWRLLHQQARQDPRCDEALRTWIATRLSGLLTRRGFELNERDAPTAEQRRVLEEALSYRTNWQAAAGLGRLAMTDGDYGEAAARFQAALVSIDDPQETPTAPPPAVIERVVRLAAEARMLADDYVASPVTRAGTPGGLAAPSVRGVALVSIPLPVEFRFDSTEFTAKGISAARDLLSALAAEGAGSITLIGHTDPRGSEAYNLRLSLARAEAVAAFLLAEGYPGRIEVRGEGERHPPVLSDPAAYTEEQRHQLSRRVELVRQ